MTHSFFSRLKTLLRVSCGCLEHVVSEEARNCEMAWVRHAQENQCVASHRIAMFADDHLIGYVFDTNDY